ncbi:hypothetical protein [Flavihumibacter sp. ZG627]|uniref:hypothetical protein n=1 Tax=Flavihumibacter sp. ZG627 TaxID=1463156 RepID=UPI00057DB5C5|nr:hypothetical protein [Flavihumibacter sp. ZG627]KIC92593.1 hypothetical protein HY58_03445 [Flavihumibacter sp. ZG627]
MTTLKFKAKEITRFELKKTDRAIEIIIASRDQIDLFEALRRTGFFLENLAKSKISFMDMFLANRPCIPKGWFVIGDELH